MRPAGSPLGLPRVALGLSLAAFGAVGWLTAHSLTWALFAHHHGPGPEHLNAESVLLTGALALGAVSLLALAIAAASSGRRRGGPGVVSPVAFGRMTLFTPVAFVAAELVEHIACGTLIDSPVPVLIVGVVLHALIGSATPVLWMLCIRAAGRCGLLAPFAPAPALAAAAGPAPSGLAAAHRGGAVRGRGPPPVRQPQPQHQHQHQLM